MEYQKKKKKKKRNDWKKNKIKNINLKKILGLK